MFACLFVCLFAARLTVKSLSRAAAVCLSLSFFDQRGRLRCPQRNLLPFVGKRVSVTSDHVYAYVCMHCSVNVCTDSRSSFGFVSWLFDLLVGHGWSGMCPSCANGSPCATHRLRHVVSLFSLLFLPLLCSSVYKVW